MKYKKGDFVKVVATIHGHKFKEGDIIVIVSVQEDANDYYCKRGRQSWYLKDEEIKKIGKRELQALNNKIRKTR